MARVVTREQRERLRKALEMERERITKSSDGMSMLGKELVMPTGCIEDIVERSPYIQSEADLQGIMGLRKDITSSVYHVFISYFNS